MPRQLGAPTELAAKVDLLRLSPYFRSVPPERLRELAARLRERRYRGGELILQKGESCPGLCFVLSGRVKTLTTSAEGREQVLKVFGPGRTFADVPVFDGEALPADALAQTDVTLAVIPRQELFEVLRRHPEAALDVVRLFATRLRAYKQVVEDLSLRDVTARVARLLLDRARGRPTLVEDAADSTLRYTHAELAAMVGSVREVVQRALKTLERAGLVELARGRITIVDPEALRAWTELALGSVPLRAGPIGRPGSRRATASRANPTRA
jgi:CRP-like cAMP-binding protein